MAIASDTALSNGLRIRLVPIEGTRAITALVAFEAGSRAERPEQNGIAHFLEHLGTPSRLLPFCCPNALPLAH